MFLAADSLTIPQHSKRHDQGHAEWAAVSGGSQAVAAHLGTRILFVVLFALVASACSSPRTEQEQVFRVGLADPTTTERLPDGYRLSFDRDELFPIYDPSFVEASQTPWNETDLVLGIELDDEPRAYPIGLLAFSEMVIDTHAGVPTLVTWCPLCGTGLVHRREINGEPVIFGNQGDLFENAMTWFDHDTGSVWSQPTGTAILGELTGTQLELLPSSLTTWGAWSELHPDTIALDTQTVRSNFTLAETLLAVVVNNETAAISVRDLREAGSVQHVLGGEPIIFTADAQTERASVLSRRTGDTIRDLTFGGGVLIDRSTNDQWHPDTGVSLTGGQNLERLPTLSTFAKDFANHFPAGELLAVE